MTKTLRVINSLFDMNPGDTFEYNNDTDMYVAEYTKEFHQTNDEDSDIKSIYNSQMSISKSYANELIKEGVLEEVNEDEKRFVNVFDEIDNLRVKYTAELRNVDEDMATYPECMKVERTTVLNNLLTVLDHLKKLKK